MTPLQPTAGAPDFSAPSRYSNPFATCWTRPGAIPFLFSDENTAERLVERLAAQNWLGEIVGPHGSGKSTLLAALVPVLERAGRRVFHFALRDGQRLLPRDAWRRERFALRIIDGYEQLGWLHRLRLKIERRGGAGGLLITSHRPTGLPPLIGLSPDRAVVERIVARLRQQAPTPVTCADIAASYACHAGNVREILFELYDRHERLVDAKRTTPGHTP